jgi:hypothetical protein
MTDELIVSSQKAFCVEHAVEYVESLPESKSGFAFSNSPLKIEVSRTCERAKRRHNCEKDGLKS